MLQQQWETNTVEKTDKSTKETQQGAGWVSVVKILPTKRRFDSNHCARPTKKNKETNEQRPYKKQIINKPTMQHKQTNKQTYPTAIGLKLH